MTVFRKLTLIFLLPASVGLSLFASIQPTIIEYVYSQRIYPTIGQGLGALTGWIPFSLGELLVILCFVLIIWQAIFFIYRVICGKISRTKIVLAAAINIMVILTLLYTGFLLLWGLNYHRQPWSTITHVEMGPAQENELRNLCIYLTDRSNTLRRHVKKDSTCVMCLPKGASDVFSRASEGFAQIAPDYPQLAGNYGKPKKILLSHALSYTGIWGIYFPFTGEANINTAIPGSMLPCITAHEMAHQRGFAREDEANFISYLTCSRHPDLDFQYSGTLFALMYSMDALSGQNPQEYKKIKLKFSPGVTRDLQQIDEYSKKHQGLVERLSSRINDTYLKANNQKNGVQSYGRMIDLLIAYYKDNLL